MQCGLLVELEDRCRSEIDESATEMFKLMIVCTNETKKSFYTAIRAMALSKREVSNLETELVRRDSELRRMSNTNINFYNPSSPKPLPPQRLSMASPSSSSHIVLESNTNPPQETESTESEELRRAHKKCAKQTVELDSLKREIDRLRSLESSRSSSRVNTPCNKTEEIRKRSREMKVARGLSKLAEENRNRTGTRSVSRGSRDRTPCRGRDSSSSCRRGESRERGYLNHHPPANVRQLHKRSTSATSSGNNRLKSCNGQSSHVRTSKKPLGLLGLNSYNPILVNHSIYNSDGK